MRAKDIIEGDLKTKNRFSDWFLTWSKTSEGKYCIKQCDPEILQIAFHAGVRAESKDRQMDDRGNSSDYWRKQGL